MEGGVAIRASQRGKGQQRDGVCSLGLKKIVISPMKVAFGLKKLPIQTMQGGKPLAKIKPPLIQTMQGNEANGQQHDGVSSLWLKKHLLIPTMQGAVAFGLKTLFIKPLHTNHAGGEAFG